MELRGEMNLKVSDASQSRISVTLAQSDNDMGGNLQFKTHPKVAKMSPGKQDKVVALKDPSSAFPVGTSLAVVKWRYAGTDESNVPLSSKFFS
jgi:hypothetical protein